MKLVEPRKFLLTRIDSRNILRNSISTRDNIYEPVRRIPSCHRNLVSPRQSYAAEIDDPVFRFQLLRDSFAVARFMDTDTDPLSNGEIQFSRTIEITRRRLKIYNCDSLVTKVLTEDSRGYCIDTRFKWKYFHGRPKSRLHPWIVHLNGWTKIKRPS